MSEPAPARPRPKPRPRPRTANAQLSNTADAPGPSNDTTGSIPLGDIVVNDSDDLFVVNRRRTRETWEKLDKINRVASRPSSDPESDRSEPSTPQKRPKTDGTPQWKKDQKTLRLLSVEISDDDDSDLEIIGETTPNKDKGLSSPGKRKRQKARPRPRSITPPPEVPAAVLANARNVIRRALETTRAPSPTAFDDFEDSTDTIVLDPELERIAKAVTSQSTKPQYIPSLATGAGEKLTVRVKWRRHPLNAAEPEPTLSYNMSRDESFRDLFDAVAEDVEILVGDLVLTHKSKRLFASARPDALGLWGEAEFVGCHQKTYDYIQQQAREVRQSQSPVKEKATYQANSVNANVIDIASDDEDSDDDYNHPSTEPINPTNAVTTTNSSPPKVSRESDAESESDAGKFKLVLRSNKVAKDITLIVRPTTKCASIVKAYIKKAGLTDQYPHIFAESGSNSTTPEPTTRGRGGKGRGRGRGRVKGKVQAQPSDPRISVDGDKMENDTEIGEADLDDGDMVEVVGL